MAPGAGLVKQGENNRGLFSRWYPRTLARRIRDIGTVRQYISFYSGDGFDLIRDYAADKTVAFYVDPPYTKAARRLYRHWQVDHEALFRELARAKGDFLMSYDNTPEIRELAANFGLQYRTVMMKNTHHTKMAELLIGRNLHWLPANEKSARPA
jgi:DNA adenine methylase